MYRGYSEFALQNCSTVQYITDIYNITSRTRHTATETAEDINWKPTTMAISTHYLLKYNFHKHLHHLHRCRYWSQNTAWQTNYATNIVFTSALEMISTLSDVHKKGRTKLLNNPYTLNCRMPWILLTMKQICLYLLSNYIRNIPNKITHSKTNKQDVNKWWITITINWKWIPQAWSHQNNENISTALSYE